MAKNSTIGLCYLFDNNSNSGIVNYVYNLISGLNSLEEEEKPKIVVFYSENAPILYLKQINYPYLKFVFFRNYSSYLIIRMANSLIKGIFDIDLYKKICFFDKVESLYPYFDFLNNGFEEARNKIHWLVDFNNRVFPEHYSDGGSSMTEYQQKITSLGDRIVLSSNSLLKELRSYYPDYKCDVKVLRFASSIPVLDGAATSALLDKYKISFPYFISPNQFWEHKNQGLILDALYILKNRYSDLSFKVIFTGSLEVNRGNGLYIEKLQQKVLDCQIGKYVVFLGVLERTEQLLLMKESVALLQPSLYEGWSTLVEEAKALNKFIILSDLPVHREQLSVNVDFFNPYNAEEIAEKMYKHYLNPPEILIKDYSQNVREFGRSILDVLTMK